MTMDKKSKPCFNDPDRLFCCIHTQDLMRKLIFQIDWFDYFVLEPKIVAQIPSYFSLVPIFESL